MVKFLKQFTVKEVVQLVSAFIALGAVITAAIMLGMWSYNRSQQEFLKVDTQKYQQVVKELQSNQSEVTYQTENPKFVLKAVQEAENNGRKVQKYDTKKHLNGDITVTVTFK